MKGGISYTVSNLGSTVGTYRVILRKGEMTYTLSIFVSTEYLWGNLEERRNNL